MPDHGFERTLQRPPCHVLAQCNGVCILPLVVREESPHIKMRHRHDLDVWMYLKDALDQLQAGSTHYESLRADVWKQSHPEAVRTYRSDERRDTADRNRLTRAQRRLANAKKLAAAKLSAKTNPAEQKKSK